MKKYLILMAIAVIFLSACEKVVELDLGEESGKLVIEANLSNTPGQQVIRISENVPFTNTNNYPPVSGAQVSITDQNGTRYGFTEGSSGTYLVNNTSGSPGSIYTMHVLLNGKAYTATSKMPETVSLDSISFKKGNFGDDGSRQITVHYTDPKGLANQYRFVMFVNDEQVKAILVNNDDFTDGNKITQELRQEDIDINIGDRVRIEMQCIDKPVYTYFSTLRNQSSDGPGGSVTPSDPPTNISPVTLGYFSAYTTSTKTITVK
ncbi:DUF4249 domain-containing protein [Pedobacter frigidisoli]|uniref:DUF4249 domain-containing protein n=1 Tax=Pedobacter frigidisoli TaxID=2530455 RepID=A0A4R0NW63_9SPHI|nr:DUF4249 domain-containing protein [Pedobacter frigidisoli]TCD05931.1 DUF4249 domain-containing protein [Pedobacter frigidisoli]